MNSTTNEQNFESMKFNPFNSCNNFLENDNDPDANIFNENLQNLNTPYILPQESDAIFQKSKTDSFSVLHVKHKKPK